MNLFALSGLLTGISSLSIGLFVYLKQRRSTLNKIWVIFTMTVAIWGFGCFKMASTANETEAFLWYRIAHIGVTLIPVFIYHFVFVFLNLKKRIILKAVYLVGGIFFAANLLDLLNSYLAPGKAYYLMIAHMKWIFDSFYMDTPPGPVYPLLVLFFFVITGMVYYELLKALRETTGVKKEQIKYFFLATLIGFIGGGSSFLPVFGINIYPLGNFATAVYPLIITYAIIRHRLLDIKIAITRAGIFAIVYSVVLVVPFWFGYVTKLWTYSVVLMAILATTGPFIYLYLRRRVEHKLQEEAYRNAEEIKGISNELVRVENIEALAKIVISLCRPVLKATYAAMYVTNRKTGYDLKYKESDEAYGSKEAIDAVDKLTHYLCEERDPAIYDELIETSPEAAKSLKALKGVIAIPAFLRSELVGILILGEKKDRHSYRQVELMALQVLSDRLATAIENALYLKMTLEAKELKQEEEIAKVKEESLKDLLSQSRGFFKLETSQDIGTYLVSMASSNLNIKHSGVYIYDSPQGKYILACWRGKGLETAPTIIDEESYLARLLRDRQGHIFYDDLKTWADNLKSKELTEAVAEADRFEATVIIPLLGDIMLGFIVISLHERISQFGSVAWHTLNVLTHNAAMAIQYRLKADEARKDSLTGLYNHRYFWESIHREVSRAARHKWSISVLFIDIDHFKRYNDTYGHDAGDAILKAMGEHLPKVCRTTDIICRIGGEEFAIILIETSMEEANLLAKRIRESLKKERILSAVTVSIGISCVVFSKEDDPHANYDIIRTAKKLHKRADEQLNRAKGEGRNRVCMSEAFRPTARGEKVKLPSVGIVEDEKKTAEDLLNFLLVKGFQATMAHRGEEGIELYKKDLPDVLLLDFGLPDINGMEVLKQVKKINPAARVWIVSAHGEEKADIIKMGAERFILKPFTLSEIEASLRELGEELV